MDIFNLLLATKGLILLVWLGLLLCLEYFFPAAPMPASLSEIPSRRWWRWGRNMGLASMNALASRFFVLPVTVFAAMHPFWSRSFAGWAGLGLDLLLLDFWIYWWHRANHEIPWLWRFHQIHHRDEFLDVTSALRFHFGEVLLSACVRGLVIMIFAISVQSVLIFETFILIAAFFHHSNWRLFPRVEKALSWIVITPGFHWLHHHAVRSDTDSTYGTVLSIWDRIFATLSKEKRVPHMSIGMPGGKEMSFLKLLRQPFI